MDNMDKVGEDVEIRKNPEYTHHLGIEEEKQGWIIRLQYRKRLKVKAQ